MVDHKVAFWEYFGVITFFRCVSCIIQELMDSSPCDLVKNSAFLPWTF